MQTRQHPFAFLNWLYVNFTAKVSVIHFHAKKQRGRDAKANSLLLKDLLVAIYRANGLCFSKRSTSDGLASMQNSRDPSFVRMTGWRS